MIRIAGVGPGRATLLEAADVPLGKSADRQVKMAAASGGGLFLLFVLGVALGELRTRRVYAADDVVHGLGMSLAWQDWPAIGVEHRVAGLGMLLLRIVVLDDDNIGLVEELIQLVAPPARRSRCRPPPRVTLLCGVGWSDLGPR